MGSYIIHELHIVFFGGGVADAECVFRLLYYAQPACIPLDGALIYNLAGLTFRMAAGYDIHY